MKRFRVNEPNVVYEAFDEEIVAVNLDSGNYYSLRGTGPTIWMTLVSGASLDDAAGIVAARYEGDSETIATAITDFADRLIAAELLVETETASADAPALAPAAEGAKPAFAPPVIEDYADMQDLLMLDPIHDVDPTGWPVAREA